MEVILFHPSIFDRALTEEGSRESVGKRPLNLRLDLLWVDRMPRVGCRYDAVNLEFSVIADRDLSTGGYVTAEAHGLGQSTKHALGRRFAPASPLSCCIQDGPVQRVFGQQFMPEGQRILACGMGEFVDEALHINAVLVQVDTAPKASRHMRVAHGIVDQEVGHAVAEMPLRTGCQQTLEHHRIFAVLDALRRYCGQNRLSGNAHMQAGDLALGIDAGGQLALGHRVVTPVQHVLLAAPDQLDRDARHLLGDADSLVNPVGAATAAEATAEHQLVDLTFGGRQAGSLGSCS